jgi:MFS family permease
MPLAAYWRLVREHPAFLSFGFLAAMSSSFGQTYFIGIFGPELQSEFALSHTDWASSYMVATLASAALLPFTGHLIDRVDLRAYFVGVVLVLASGCLLMARAVGPVSLVAAIFLLRQGGQGLMSHLAVTSMTRYFTAGRGKAIALASMGFAVGEAILPIVALAVIRTKGWRVGYYGSAALVLALVAPLLLLLLRGHGERHQNYLLDLRSAEKASSTRKVASWSLGQVLRDGRFYLLLPGVVAPAFIITAMFFHHRNLAEAKGWSHAWITGSYAIYALSSTAVGLLCGPLIDRIGGVRLVPPMLIPLALSLVLVSTVDAPWVVWPYFILAGACVGIAHTAVSAMWAEVYGVESLGAIKGLVSAAGVLASALGPLVLSAVMDGGGTVEKGCLLLAGYAALASVSTFVALRGSAAAAV